MTGIEELRQRVTDAEERFGLIDAQRAKYSERLIVLMNAIEARIHEQQDEIEKQAEIIAKHEAEVAVQQAKIDGQGTAIAQQAGEIEKLKTAGADKHEENEQLRTMLHSLLQAIESGGRDGLAEVMQELDRKASVLVSTAVTEAPAAEIGEPATVGPVSVAPFTESEEAYVDEIATEPEPGLETEPGPEIETPEAEIEPTTETFETEVEIEDPASGEIEEPVAEETENPIAEGPEEPVTEEAEKPIAEDEAAGIEEIDEPAAEGIDELAAETGALAAAAALGEAAAEDQPVTTTGGSLDEIMARVSKLVEETEAVIAVPCAPEAAAEAAAEGSPEATPETTEDAADDPIPQAAGT